MKKETSKIIRDRLQSAIRAVIDQQMAESDPPETLETFERLIEEGFSRDEVYSLIGQLVSMEVAEEIRGSGGLNIARYVAALAELPAPFAKSRNSEEDE